ncbi:MAG: hypothetical protein GYA87_08985 [Christensenellaceae bacterium]|nr:hypothetical protein [Christensenellaceae bacterium]
MQLNFTGAKRRFNMMLPGINHTDVDLGDMNPVVNAVYEFTNDIIPKYIPKNLLKLCLELSHSAYKLVLDKYAIAKWQDITIYNNNNLKSLDDFNVLRFKRPISRQKYKGVNFIYQYARHKISNNHYPRVFFASHKAGLKHVVAISIAGTGKGIGDWSNSMDMGVTNSYHSGFYKSVQSIEKISEKLMLNDTAKDLGIKSLSLYDVFKACSRENSPFILLITGHSKGSGITQILVQRLMDEYGVKAGNIIGVGFASPKVVNHSFKGKKYSYPTINIINNDDPIGRIVSMAQLGYCLGYDSNAAMRKKSYSFDRYRIFNDEIKIAKTILPKILSMSDALAFMYAYFSYLNMFADDELNNFFETYLIKIKQASSIYDFLPKKFIAGKLEEVKNLHLEICNEHLQKSRADYYFNIIKPLFEANKIKNLSAAIFIVIMVYHSLVGTGKNIGPYKYIVNNLNNKPNCYAWDENCNKIMLKNNIIIGRKLDIGIPIPSPLNIGRILNRQKRLILKKLRKKQGIK